MSGLGAKDITGLGGEAQSLAMQYPEADKFRAAGYANLTVNSTYNGGVVRQYNGVSFSRVFDSGHSGERAQSSKVLK